jgi:gas vesicle protein
MQITTKKFIGGLVIGVVAGGLVGYIAAMSYVLSILK